MIRISYKESTAGVQLPAYHTGHHALEFSGDVVTIGRSRVCDLVLADELVSGSHCEIRVRAGALFLVDLDSTNGTFIKEQGVSIQPITSADIVRIGATTFIASYEEVTETSGLHPPGTVRRRLEPASLEQRPTRALAARRADPPEQTAAFPSPPPAEPRPLKPSLLGAAGLVGLACLFFENNMAALLPIAALFGLNAVWRHLDNQSLILKELRRLGRDRLPTGSGPVNL